VEEKVPDFLYTSWFRDDSLLPSDEDHEWPCCFLIAADTEADALTWGDHLAAGYCGRSPQCAFLRSHLEPASPGDLASVLRVAVGVKVSDDVIGW
jgi:hypothetical protein